MTAAREQVRRDATRSFVDTLRLEARALETRAKRLRRLADRITSPEEGASVEIDFERGIVRFTGPPIVTQVSIEEIEHP